MNNYYPIHDETQIDLIPNYDALPIIAKYQCVNDYLNSIDMVMSSSVKDYRVTFAIRVDLRFPYGFNDFNCDSDCMKKFIASLNAQLLAGENRRATNGIRIRPNTLRFIWARERYSSNQDHFHLVLLFNKDAYYSLGCLQSNDNKHLCTKIVNAWCSALGYEKDNIDDYHSIKGLVYFPKNATYIIHRDDRHFYQRAFFRFSYLAKLETKSNIHGGRAFGYSYK